MDDILTLIGTHEVFESLQQKELQTLQSIIKRETYSKNGLVYDTSQSPKFLFYIETGSFQLTLPGNVKLVLRPGQLIGEVGVINQDFRSGTVVALEDSSLISICGTRLFNEDFVQPSISLKILRALSKRITNYLRSKNQVATRELIHQGENEHVEFKSTLRWNTYTNKKDAAIEHAILKTIAAFLNAEGGVLLIGVADDGELLGLNFDQFNNDDKMLLHITTMVKKSLGSIFLKYIDFSIETIDEQKLLRVDCKPSNIPAYMKDGNAEHFYIRTGPATTDLQVSKIHTYIMERFDQEI